MMCLEVGKYLQQEEDILCLFVCQKLSCVSCYSFLLQGEFRTQSRRKGETYAKHMQYEPVCSLC